ncbi:hypothetical protein [Rhizobium phage RHph_X66]|nr:hypothetical protein [Rhizobium phage RHph_X66]
MANRGWYGVDFDGTLATYDTWKGIDHVGEPIWPMINRVKTWLAAGKEVRIFTARCAGPEDCKPAIEKFCLEHIGQVLPITNIKDFGLIELWDDRAVRVEENTGQRIL